MGAYRIRWGLVALGPMALAFALPSQTATPVAPSAIPASWFVAPSSHTFIQEPEKKPEPLKVAPRAYFIDHCQRCHGVDGSNLIPGFAEKETLEKLKYDVKRMADGAGQAPLEDKDIDVQTAYMQLASVGKPFLAWTGINDTTLIGETADGSTLVATVGDKPIKVEVDDDFHWKLTLESMDDLGKLKLTATYEKKSSVLEPAKSAYSVLPKPEKKDGVK